MAFGWDDAAALAVPIISGMFGQAGQESTNTQNSQINNAQMGFNAAEADKNRAWQEQQRGTGYQTAVADLKLAGLNPMLAYSNGPAKAGAGGQASSGNMLPMQNTNAAGLNSAAASATIANTQANTRLQEAQAAKLSGVDTQNTQTSTAKMRAETENLGAIYSKIGAEIAKIAADRDLAIKQGYTQTDLGNLYRAQQDLAKIEGQLKNNTMDLQDAQRAGQLIVNRLKEYEIPGAKNLANFETMMDTEGGNASKMTGAVANTVNTVRKALGK